MIGLYLLEPSAEQPGAVNVDVGAGEPLGVDQRRVEPNRRSLRAKKRGGAMKNDTKRCSNGDDDK